jgi:predicted RNase H-like nuclease
MPSKPRNDAHEVVGVDWAGSRWACVLLGVGTTQVASESSFDAVIERFSYAAAIAVDIPIGLPETSPWRRADQEARKLVHPSTVFPTFPRAVYECALHGDAVALCRERGWPGISRQSYGLWKRISEVEPYADLAHEVHPEVSFWKLNGEVRLAASKHTWNGFFERKHLLEHNGVLIEDGLPEDLPALDVLDAAAAAWTALRIAQGGHKTLPASPEPGESTIAY